MKKFVIALAVGAVLLSPPYLFAAEASNASAAASIGMSLVSANVVVGSVHMLDASGHWVVESIQRVGDGSLLVLKNVADGVMVSIRTTGAIAGTASLAVGSGVEVSTQASGHALIASGKVIAFIPNEVGQSLIHSKKSAERS